MGVSTLYVGPAEVPPLLWFFVEATVRASAANGLPNCKAGSTETREDRVASLGRVLLSVAYGSGLLCDSKEGTSKLALAAGIDLIVLDHLQLRLADHVNVRLYSSYE